MKPKASAEEVRATFASLINMTAPEIRDWHKTAESASVGQDSGDGVSVGVKAGKRTILLLGSKRVPDEDDIKHMRRVISFVRRLSMQAPTKKRETSRWRYALMNWGHDPLKPTDADSPWR